MVNELDMSFKKLILFSALTVLLGISLVYALSYEFKPKNSTQTLPTAEGVDEQLGLKLTMTLEKTDYSLGEQVNITMTLTNISNQTINYDVWAGSFDFRVYNDTNNNIYQWSNRVLPYVMIEVTLNPEDALAETRVWYQTCNNTAFSEGVPVSPGTYYIVGQTGLICEINGRIETTPMQIVIKP
jgi:hypothetical protein